MISYQGSTRAADAAGRTAQLIELASLMEIFMDNSNTASPDRLLKVGDVLSILNISRSSLYTAMRVGTLPKPVKIGKSARWKSSVILALVHELGN